MFDFGAVVYLDVPKTASTFIGNFLRRQMRAPLVRFEKHAPVARREPGVLYLASVRDPLRHYVSLFRYGLDRRGGLHACLVQAGRGALYDVAAGDEAAAFERWLAVVLDPANAAVLGGDHAAPELFGILTHRYLAAVLPIDAPRPHRAMTREALGAFHAAQALPGAIVRTEALAADLAGLIARELSGHLVDPRRALRFVARRAAVNASRAGAALATAAFSRDLVAEVRRREWLLYELFYPER